MKEKIRSLINKKAFHISILIVIITMVLFCVGINVLKYNVEGEKNMPFFLSKIVIISSVEGTDKEAGENKWAFDISQNNDFNLYIEKNKNYAKQEIINSILIDNINIEKNKEKGIINLYRPNTTDSGVYFKNTEENLVQTIEYKGAMQTDLKKLEISNQGGLIMFRYANDKIAEYTSNDDEIIHNELLKKANLTMDDLKSTINMDLTIKLESGKEYKTNIQFDLPIDGVIENGISSKETTDTSNFIFKRIKN